MEQNHFFCKNTISHFQSKAMFQQMRYVMVNKLNDKADADRYFGICITSKPVICNLFTVFPVSNHHHHHHVQLLGFDVENRTLNLHVKLFCEMVFKLTEHYITIGCDFVIENTVLNLSDLRNNLSEGIIAPIILLQNPPMSSPAR